MKGEQVMTTKSRNKKLALAVSSHRVASSSTDDAIYDFLSALNSPRSLAVWLLYRTGEHQQLVDLKIDPDAYPSMESFRDAYQATEFLSKSSFLRLDVNKSEAAFSKFLEFEELCGKTNKRFKNLSFDPLFHGSNVWLLNGTIRKIDQILGSYSADEFVDNANWGPGVTTLVKGSHVSAFNKFQTESGITRQLYNFISPWFGEAYPRWAETFSSSPDVDEGKHFRIEVGNEVITVPKNAKTDRVIAVEPGMNQWFQKGIGCMIRRRLRRAGVDLNSQERNQELARIGSIDNRLATVDFSSASDSISKELVRTLLRPDWYLLLDLCRSTTGTRDGTPFIWNKFSSMGNGFTFELESLIFFAAALAVCEYLEVPTSEVSVFGDDVIIPSNCFELFEQFCEFLGFRVNRRKSFSTGYFRESCGSHYYSGSDCKPLYLKDRITNVSSIFKLANRVRDLAHRCRSFDGCDARFRHAWNRLFQGVPKHLRFRIPSGYGDGGFVSNFDEATPVIPDGGIEGYLFLGVIDTGVTQYSDKPGMLLARLWGRSIREYGNNYTLRGQTRLRVKRILAFQWYNLGGWM